MTPKEILNKFFGFSEFRPAQEEIINSIIMGESVLTVLPTGGGKSICYQIPALISANFSIVVSPLIALMKDQVDSLNSKKNISAFINSSLDSRTTEKVMCDLASGKIKILYVSPEKLSNKNFAEKIKSLSPNYLFVDEAHCISEWGHNFRPSYRKIKEFIEFTGIKNVSAFTATATEDVRKDIIKQLGFTNPKVFVRGFERANFHLNVFTTAHKKEKAVELLKGKNESAIIYTSTRKLAEEVANFLRTNRIDAVYYHAGLTPELRRIIQDDFLSGRVKTIVATNAFGMGIDKSDIRTIIHYNLPGSIENYYQEIGRAGRDGKESNIFLLYDEKDKLIQDYFISASNPSRKQIEDVYDMVGDSVNAGLGTIPSRDIPLDANIFSLLGKKEITHGLIDSSLRVLEESGYIKIKSDFDSKHFGQFLLDPNRLNAYVKNFTDNEMKDLILILAREYGSRIFNSPAQLNVNKLADVLELSTNEIIGQLKRIAAAGIFKYEEPLLVPSVTLLKPRVFAKELNLDIKHISMVAEHSRMKLEKMIGYVFTDICRSKYILEYFGESDENYKCRKCDRCTGKTETGKSSLHYLEEIILQTIHEAKLPIKKKNLIEIITGKTDLASLKRFSTFGSCVHFHKDEIENSISNLKRTKLLIISKNVLSLSKNGTEIFTIVEEEVSPQHANLDYENELILFNQLRQIRKEAADKFNQLANIICTDEILRTIAKEKPTNYTDMLNIKGFTRTMFNKVGEDFLNTIKDFIRSTEMNEKVSKKKLPDNIAFILELIQKKYSLADISTLTKLPEAIVSTQIEVLIEAVPELEIDFLFDKNELNAIYKKIDDGIFDLKELRNALNGSISYAKLRIAAAKKRVS